MNPQTSRTMWFSWRYELYTKITRDNIGYVSTDAVRKKKRLLLMEKKKKETVATKILRKTASRELI